jgi:hypothetical protein
VAKARREWDSARMRCAYMSKSAERERERERESEREIDCKGNALHVYIHEAYKIYDPSNGLKRPR